MVVQEIDRFALTVASEGFSIGTGGRSIGRFVMRTSTLLPGLILLAVSGCASPESRVRSSLIRIGLPHDTAECMADNVASKLSSQQIRDLSRLSGLSERRIGEMTIGEFTGLLTRSGNLEMVELFARAGVGCAIMR